MKPPKASAQFVGGCSFFPFSDAPVLPRVTCTLLSAFLLWASHLAPLTVVAASAHKTRSSAETDPPRSSCGSAGGVTAGLPRAAAIPRRWGGAGRRQLEESRTGAPTQGCGCGCRRGSGSAESLVRCAGESGFIFTIKLILK